MKLTKVIEKIKKKHLPRKFSILSSNFRIKYVNNLVLDNIGTCRYVPDRLLIEVDRNVDYSFKIGSIFSCILIIIREMFLIDSDDLRDSDIYVLSFLILQALLSIKQKSYNSIVPCKLEIGYVKINCVCIDNLTVKESSRGRWSFIDNCIEISSDMDESMKSDVIIHEIIESINSYCKLMLKHDHIVFLEQGISQALKTMRFY